MVDIVEIKSAVRSGEITVYEEARHCTWRTEPVKE